MHTMQVSIPAKFIALTEKEHLNITLNHTLRSYETAH